jgi:methylated-DNA-protein-cysteine methyltransferase-like protein
MPNKPTPAAHPPVFPRRVWDIVKQVPRGRVTTYGHIARALGSPRAARQVGWALHAPPPDEHIPCHRVVNRIGVLSGAAHFGEPDAMRGLLLAEGVPFIDDLQVDLAAVLWVPWRDGLDGPPADEVDDLEFVAVDDDGGGE